MKNLHRKTIPLIGLIMLFIFSDLQAQDCNCTETIDISDDDEEPYDGSVPGAVGPGDTLCLTGRRDGVFHFKNIVGEADAPIIIRNKCDEQAVFYSTSNKAIRFQYCEHFEFKGYDLENTTYADGIAKDMPVKGIKVTTESDFYLYFHFFTTNFKVSGIEVAGIEPNGIGPKNGFSGIGIKTVPGEACDSFLVSPPDTNWIMRDVHVYDNYIHDVGGEGIYMGVGNYAGTDKFCDGDITYPHLIRGVWVYNNLIENVGWDGIQIKNADSALYVYDNIVHNVGWRGHGSHDEGIFIGSGSVGEVYNNKVFNVPGVGFQYNGLGKIDFYNNLLVNIGFDGPKEAFYFNGKHTKSFELPEEEDVSIRIFNNTLVKAAEDGVVLYNYGTDDSEDPDKITEVDTIIITNNIFAEVDGVMWRSVSEEYRTNNIENDPIEDIKLQTYNPCDQGYDENCYQQFIDGDYTLSDNSSVAVNSGSNAPNQWSLSAFTNDLAGKDRLIDGTYDIGAYEFQGSGTTNNPPTITSTVDQEQTITTGKTSTFVVYATDEDSLTFSRHNHPDFVTLQNPGRDSVVVQIAPVDTSGTWSNINIIATDLAEKADTITFSLTVNPNSPPVLTAIDPQTVYENTTTEITATASDVNGDSLSFSLINPESFITLINPGDTSVTIQIAPGSGTAGTYPGIGLVADDGNADGLDTVYFDVEVQESDPDNGEPVLTSVEDLSVDEGGFAEVEVTASDPDQDSIRFSFDGTPPSFFSLAEPNDTSTVFRAEPGQVDAGTYPLAILATDGKGGDDTVSFVVTVNEVNVAPAMDSIADQTVTTGSTELVLVSATDADHDDLTFSLHGEPAYVSISSDTITISPESVNVGRDTVAVVVSDGSLQDTTAFVIEVIEDDPENADPVIDSIADQTTPEGTPITVSVLASDPEGDSLSFSLLSAPPFVTIANDDATSATITIDPEGIAGTDPAILVVADDQKGGTDTTTFALTVTRPSGDALYRINSGGDTITVTGEVGWYRDKQTDPSPYHNNSGLTTGPNNWDGPNGTNGPNDIFGSYRKVDTSYVDQHFYFPVGNGDYEVRLYFNSDPDEETSAGTNVFDVLIEDSTALDEFDVYAQAGGNGNPMEVSFIASVNDDTLDIYFPDPTVGKSLISGVEILEAANTFPVISAIQDQSVSEGTSISVGVSATDSDGDSLSFSLVSAPPFVTIANDDATNATITITPEDIAGTDPAILVVADDQKGGTDTTTFALTVTRPSGDALYRINSGGDTITVTGEVGWYRDKQTDPSPYHNNSGLTTGPNNWDGPNGTNGPKDIFGSYRKVDTSYVDQHFYFPVGSGDYEVRLYFNSDPDEETSAGTNVFDVLIEDSTALDEFDVYAQAGGNGNPMEVSFVASVNDDTLDIYFPDPTVGKSLISGVEILEAANTAPVISAIQDQSVSEGTSISVGVSATDSDGDDITFSLVSGPSFVTISNDSHSSGTISIDPVSIAGTWPTITVVSDDQKGGTDTTSFALTVTRPSGDALYRINTGGDTIAVTGEVGWYRDKQSDPSPYHNNVGLTTGSNAWSGTNNTNAPDSVFGNYRYSDSQSTLEFDFTESGGLSSGVYEVRLYFVSPDDTPSAGSNIFDVVIEGDTALNDFDIVAVGSGPDMPMEVSFLTQVDDGNLDLDFPEPVTGYSIISGVEILTVQQDQIYYRVNAGGILENDSLVDWSKDKQTDVSPYFSENSTNYTTGSNTWSGGTNGTSAPDNIFGNYRYDNQNPGERQQWNFPVYNGSYEVTLYFMSDPTKVSLSGTNVFDVEIEGTLVLDEFDIYATAGGTDIPIEESFIVDVSDGNLDIDFPRISSGWSIISGIQIRGASGGTSARIDGASLIAEKDNGDISIYPNPFSNELHIVLNTNKENERVLLSLMDNTGKVLATAEDVHYENGKVISLDVERLDLASGLYMLHIKTSKGIETRKLIKP